MLTRRRVRRDRHSTRQLALEALEERCLLSYSVTDLGTLGGDESDPFGLNAFGQAVGRAQVAAFPHPYHAFRYSDGVMTDLDDFGSTHSLANSINDFGQVVGGVFVSGVNSHAFLWDDSSGMQDLGTLGGETSDAFAINNLGWIVGHSAVTGTFLTHAFLYQDGKMTDLGTLGGARSIALGINDTGRIVGGSETVGGYHAFVTNDDGTLRDLGTLGGSVSSASAVNANDQVAGDSDLPRLGDGNPSPHHAFLWEDGQFTDLGTLGGVTSFAYGINKYGQVVGAADTQPGGFIPHAFIYSDGAMTDLNRLLLPDGPAWDLSEARGINDAGQILCYGVSARGSRHSVLLTPSDGTSAAALRKHSAFVDASLAQTLAGSRGEHLPSAERIDSLVEQPRTELQALATLRAVGDGVLLPAPRVRQASDLTLAAERDYIGPVVSPVPLDKSLLELLVLDLVKAEDLGKSRQIP